jgi:peptide/nickel transport system substrate-binding protein
MKRRFLLATTLSVILAAGCGGGGEKKAGGGGKSGDGNTLTIAFDTSPTNLDPRVGNDQGSGRVGDLTWGALVQPSIRGDYDADLAEKWETPDDKTIVFHLRPNLKFHNGKPLTSADVKWTYESMLAEGFTSPKKAGYKVLDHIETPDAQTVIFKLKEPNGGMMDNLTLGIVPQGSDTNIMKNAPISAGPYRVTNFTPDERVELEAFDGYYAGAPKIKHVIYRIVPDATTRVLEMRRGTVDFESNSIPNDSVAEFEKNPDWKVLKEPGAVYQYLAFNMRDKALSKKPVREAIAHAIDRQKIVTDLLHGYGTVTETMFPKGHWVHNDNLPTHEYNPAKSKQLLDAAGFPDPDGDGPKTRFNLVYKTSTDSEANQQAEIIQQMLKAVGIGVTIQSNEFSTFYDDIQKGKFQLYSLRRTGLADPDFYSIIFSSKSMPPDGQNRGFYSNPKMDQLIEQGRATFDRAKRKAAYDQIQQIAAEDLPYLSLYTRYNIVAMKKNLEGFQMYPSGFLLPVKSMSFSGGK